MSPYTRWKSSTRLGATPVTCSDSNGMVYHKSGIDLDLVKQIKEENHERLKTYLDTHDDAEYIAREDYPEDGHSVWRYEGYRVSMQRRMN